MDQKSNYMKKVDTEFARELSAVRDKQDSLVEVINDIKSTLNKSLQSGGGNMQSQGNSQNNNQISGQFVQEIQGLRSRAQQQQQQLEQQLQSSIQQAIKALNDANQQMQATQELSQTHQLIDQVQSQLSQMGQQSQSWQQGQQSQSGQQWQQSQGSMQY